MDPSCSGDPCLVVWVLLRWRRSNTSPDCPCPGKAPRAAPPPHSSPPQTWAAAGLWLVRQKYVCGVEEGFTDWSSLCAAVKLPDISLRFMGYFLLISWSLLVVALSFHATSCVSACFLTPNTFHKTKNWSFCHQLWFIVDWRESDKDLRRIRSQTIETLAQNMDSILLLLLQEMLCLTLTQQICTTRTTNTKIIVK